MTTNVTVQTSATTSVLVPFTSAANAAAVQAVLNAGANNLATLGVMKYFSPPNTAGAVTLPSVSFSGGVIDTVPAALNFGIMDNKYQSLVNGGSGLTVAIGGVNTTLVSGASGQNIYVNQSTSGQAYLGGGNNVLGNAFSISNMTAQVDGAGGLGTSTLIIDDSVGGAMNVTANGGNLIALQGGGADAIIGQGGTVVVLASKVAGAAAGTATISTSGAGTDLWVGAQGGSVFVNPGAGNAFLFQAGIGENSATLFGGTKTIGGVSRTAAAYTGKSTVLGMNGYLESGSAGGSIMQTGTTAGAATLVAGGAGDILLVRGAGDLINVGNAANVIASAGAVLTGVGDQFLMGSGSGSVFGAANGHNTFTFRAQGNYTVAGFHDTTVAPSAAGFLAGSTYNYTPSAVGGTGHIVITDFLPRQTPAGTVFDKFDLGSTSVTSLTSVAVSGGFNNTAVLADGTTIDFLKTNVAVSQSGTTIV